MLTITFICRSNLVEDSLKEISEKQKDLKKKLKISFVGEPGLDMGGLTKEWFQGRNSMAPKFYDSCHKWADLS